MKAPKDLNTADCLIILWLTTWLFTTALAHLSLGQCLLALVIWPYYLGEVVARISGS
jgi:hypothetical protein